MKNKTRTEYSVLNILTGVSGYVLNTLLGFVCRMVFVKYLSADYLGVNGLFTNILTMLSLAELGVGSAVVFALYKPLAKNDEKKIASLVQFYGRAYISIGLVIGVIGLLLLPFLDVIITEQPQIHESIYLLYLINLFNTSVTYFFSYRSSLLVAAQQNYIVSGINYVITILQSIVQMGALILTHNYLVYLLIQTIGTLLYNVIISKIAIKKYPFIKSKDIEPLTKNEKESLFANIRDLMIYKISGLLVNSTDNILITFFNGLTTTGITSNYTLLINTLNSLLSQMFNGLTASIGNHNALSNNKERLSMYKFLELINFWFYSWATLGILYCSSDIVRLCFGGEYVLPNHIVFVMAANFYIAGSTNIIGMYKDTLGLFHYGRFIQVFTGIINIILSILLGINYGVFGILLATGIARICTHFWYTPYVVYKYGFGENVIKYVIKYIKYISVLMVMSLACWFFFYYLNIGTKINIVLKILFCSIIINVILLIVFFRTEEFKKLKNYLSIHYNEHIKNDK